MEMVVGSSPAHLLCRVGTLSQFPQFLLAFLPPDQDIFFNIQDLFDVA